MIFLPSIVNAATGNVDDTVNTIVSKITAHIVIPAVQFVFALAVVLFIWGLMGFFMGGDDSTKRQEGQRHILWGTIGMAIMVSVYGIIRFVASTVGQNQVIGF